MEDVQVEMIDETGWQMCIYLKSQKDRRGMRVGIQVGIGTMYSGPAVDISILARTGNMKKR